ncbi:unnamed protein product [Penicillium olsonii]|nr:unnamed protein product [Penicillium olsonii]
MDTRDQFSLDHTSYPSLDASPQYPSGYLPIVEYRFLQTDVQNYDLFYEQPPSAPFLAEPPEPPPSSISSPPKYRTIQPRPSATSPDAKNPGDTLQIKPGKRQWRPQDTSGESTSNDVPFSQCTNSGLCSSNQEQSFAPYRPFPSNDLGSVVEVRSPLFLNGASEAPATDGPACHHYAHCSLDPSDRQFSCPNASFEIDQNQDAMRAASIQLSEHLERTQVMQSLSIVQDYMARHPSIFEDQAPDMIQRWLVEIESVELSECMST